MPDPSNETARPYDPYAYFVREATRFRPTQYVGGAWDTREQHIARPSDC